MKTNERLREISAWHRLKHLLGIWPADLLQVVHAVNCDGDCIVMHRKVCNHWLELKCRECGRVVMI